MTTSKQRNVTILVRYFVKTGKDAGNVLLLVRNDQGKEYCITLRKNKHHSCNCEGYTTFKKTCYHIKHCRSVENARYDASKATSALLAEIETICQEAEIELTASSTETVTPVVVIPARELAPLNGNRHFSILRK
jgi:hypothetical protein